MEIYLSWDCLCSYVLESFNSEFLYDHKEALLSYEWWKAISWIPCFPKNKIWSYFLLSSEISARAYFRGLSYLPAWGEHVGAWRGLHIGWRHRRDGPTSEHRGGPTTVKVGYERVRVWGSCALSVPAQPLEPQGSRGRKGTETGVGRPTILCVEWGTFAPRMLGGHLPGLAHLTGDRGGGSPETKHWQSPRGSRIFHEKLGRLNELFF